MMLTPPPLSAEWDDPDNPVPENITARRHRRRNFHRQHPLDTSNFDDNLTDRERDDDISFGSSADLPTDNIQVSFDIDPIDTIDDDSLASSNIDDLPLMLQDLDHNRKKGSSNNTSRVKSIVAH